MSKVLSSSIEKSLANVVRLVYQNPNRRYLFSKKIVSEIAECATYAKNEERTPDGSVNVYELTNEKNETVTVTFGASASVLGTSSGTNIDGYILREIVTAFGKKIKVEFESDDVVIIM